MFLKDLEHGFTPEVFFGPYARVQFDPQDDFLFLRFMNELDEDSEKCLVPGAQVLAIPWDEVQGYVEGFLRIFHGIQFLAGEFGKGEKYTWL